MSEQRGYSLIELLIAMAISTLLLQMLFKIYIANFHTSKSIAELIQITSNINIIRNIISTDLHQAKSLITTPNTLQIDQHLYYLSNKKSLYMQDGREKNEIVHEILGFNVIKGKKLLKISLDFEKLKNVPIVMYYDK